MDRRRDALAGAAKLALEIRGIAKRTGDGAVCTSGSVVCKPGIVTSVVETAEQLLDQRHLDAGKLAAMLAEAKEAAERFAAEEDVEVSWERIWSIEPILFQRELVDMCDASIEDVAGASHRLPSGPLHDAAEVSRAGIPTVMMFVQSLRGLSHTKLEDTRPEHLELAVEAFDHLTTEAIAWVAGNLVAGKTLLVFGARHLGRTVARELAADGWNVAAVARSEETIASFRGGVAGRTRDRRRRRRGGLASSAHLPRRTAVRAGHLVVNAITARPRGSFGGGTLAEASPDAMEPYVDELLPGIFNVGSCSASRARMKSGGRRVPPWMASCGYPRARSIYASPRQAKPDAAPTRTSRAIAYLESQSPRAWTHELQITPRLDRWVP